MSVITIPNEIADQSFTVGGTPTTGPWSFTFRYFEKDDLVVTFDDGGGPDVISPSAFAVIGAAVEGGFVGGSLTLSVAVASGTLRVYRDMNPVRTDNFSPAPFVNMRDLDVSLNRTVAMVQDLKRLGGVGGGIGGIVEWSNILHVPAILGALAVLTPASGQIVEFTGANSAHMIATPSGAGSTAYSALTSIPALIDAIDGLTPASGQMIEFTGPTSAHLIATPSGGSGSMQPRELSVYGSVDATGANPTTNDPTIALAEAAADGAVYLRDGIYAKSAATPAFSNLTKGYQGRGKWKEGTSILPAAFTYLTSKPTTAATQGLTGWFDGDQRATRQSYLIIGAGIRTFDLALRYYESNVIRNNSWLDVLSGNSGANALLKSGANPGMGTVIPLPFAADASWVGKTVGFNNSYGGTILETRTVTAVNTAGNNININAALTNTYVWNPPTTMPTLVFATRSWSGNDYVKIVADGGGDHYGHNIRMNAKYVPKATETHPFMAGTFSQYGGDVTALADGNYLQSWESQIQGGIYDIWAISFVQSMVRNVDAKLDGRFWGGTWIQSGGAKPIDSFHTVLGAGRIGLDTVFATLIETGTLAAQFTNGTATMTAVSVNGIHPKDTITIGGDTLIVDTVNGGTKVVTFTTNATATYAIGTGFTVNSGGVALNMALGHRICWNSSLSATERGSDFSGVFSTPYGNKQGDLLMGSGNDGTDYWQVRFADGGSNATPDSGRLRLRRGGIQIFGTGQHSINGTSFSFTSGCSLNLSLASGAKLTLGAGIWIEVQGGVAVITNNGGGSFAPV